KFNTSPKLRGLLREISIQSPWSTRLRIWIVIPTAIHHIIPGDPLHLSLQQSRTDRLDLAGRNPGIDAALLNDGTLQDHRSGRDYRMASNLHPIHDNGPHADDRKSGV